MLLMKMVFLPSKDIASSTRQYFYEISAQPNPNPQLDVRDYQKEDQVYALQVLPNSNQKSSPLPLDWP